MRKDISKTLTAYPRLQEKEIQNPQEALEYFFTDFPLAEAKKYLWDFYQGWVMSDLCEYADSKVPATMLFFYTHLDMLIEAASLINKK